MYNFLFKSMNWFYKPSWLSLVLLTFFHFATSFVIFEKVEPELMDNNYDRVYFYMVTGSSVGYGDISPSTETGKMVASFYFIPGAFLIIAMFFTKIITSSGQRIQTLKEGKGIFRKMKNHIVIIGYVENATEGMIKHFKEYPTYKKLPIIVVSEDDVYFETDNVEVVRTTNISSKENLVRAGTKEASSIVVMSNNDEETFAAALSANSLKKTDATLSCSFSDPTYRETLTDYIGSDARVIIDHMYKQLAKTVTCKGVSEVFDELSDESTDFDIYTYDVVDNADVFLTVGQIEEKYYINVLTIKGRGANVNNKFYIPRTDSGIPLANLEYFTYCAKEKVVIK